MKTYTQRDRKMPCGVRGCIAPAVGSWRRRAGWSVYHLCDTHAGQFQRKGRKVARWVKQEGTR